MVRINQTLNVNGESYLTVDGKEVQVAYMSASVNIDGVMNINHQIHNKELFEKNKSEIRKDLDAFDDYVYSLPEKHKEKEGGADGV